MFYMTPKIITVGDIYGKSVILTVWGIWNKINNKGGSAAYQCNG